MKGKFNLVLLERWYPMILSIITGFCIADLALLNIRPEMLPNQAPPAKPPRMLNTTLPSSGTFNVIASKNIFSWDGTIPEALTAKGVPGKGGSDQEPVPSQLPLTLVGTIVHSTPEKSVASIEIKSKNMSVSVRPKAEVENMAEIMKVERNKVIFRNLNNNQIEFIEVQSKSKISFQGSSPRAESNGGGADEVKMVGRNQFSLNRNDVLKYTSNLASLLQQARSAPHRNQQTGEIDGFTILDYQSGSIFEKLGLKRMDVLKMVNGEVVDSPAKAMELYNALKNSDKVSLTVDRDGRSEVMDYNINQ